MNNFGLSCTWQPINFISIYYECYYDDVCGLLNLKVSFGLTKREYTESTNRELTWCLISYSHYHNKN